MSEFKKDSLLKTLDNIEKIHEMLLVFLIFLTHKDSGKILEQSTMSYLNKQLDLKKIKNELEDKSNMSDNLIVISDNIEDYLLREPMTIIKEYCRLNNLEKELHDQKWFSFANILRNYVTHGFLDYEKHYKTKTFPIQWKDNKITREEVKTSKIIFNNFEYGFQMDLFNEIKKFAKNLPQN